MKKIFFVLGFFFLGAQLQAAQLTVYKRKYKYYLDPERAEEIFGGISLLPRMTKEAWLEKLGKKRDQNYKVTKGDTLWAISAKEFGSPWLWRKLWQENPDLSNPHDLAVGHLLSYYREELEPEPLYIPLIKLGPSKAGNGMDLDSDSISGNEVRNVLRPLFFVVDEDKILGEVTGAFTRAEGLNSSDEMYLRMDEMENIRVGDRFTVVRYDKELRDATAPSKPYLGRLVRSVADIVVLQIGDKLVKAEPKEEFDFFKRGDKVIAPMSQIEMNAFFNPPEDLRLRVVAGEHEDMKMFSEGDVVMLNRGAEDGVRDGQVFRAVRDTDPKTESDSDVEPDPKAEVNIIMTSKKASIGYVSKTKTPLIIGDTLLASQLFPNPPPRPKREVETLLLD